MPDWREALDRWRAAGLIDEPIAENIRAFEASREAPRGLRWPAIIALVFGGLMLGAGVLLFVGAHWEELSPGQRFSLVVGMVGLFHGAGIFATSKQYDNFAIVMHGLGTASLGAGIFLAGQIFNMAAHWPSGILLWAAGAWAGYALRRDWVQFAMAAILTPLWLGGEWVESFPRFDLDNRQIFRVFTEGAVLLALTYLAAPGRGVDSPARKALVWIGGIAFLPWVTVLAFERELSRYGNNASLGPREVLGYAVAFGFPLALAWFLRKRDMWMNAVAAVWVFAMGFIAAQTHVGVYLWCVLGAAGLIAWGIRDGRSERVNLGMVGFAATLLVFYFSEVMDKLDRSASLVALGVLFLAGGWGLERMRRKFVAQVRNAP